MLWNFFCPMADEHMFHRVFYFIVDDTNVFVIEIFLFDGE